MNRDSRWLIVPWVELERWDYLSNYQRRTLRCSYPLVPIGDLMGVRKQMATEEELSAGEVRMVDRVSFEGEIFAGERQQTKMVQWLAEPGDIIVSKIRARQGSVGLVESSNGKVSVTIHYRVLTPDAKKVEAKFAHLAMRSAFGRAQFLAATGGAMKGEISEEGLLNVRLPLPPLPDPLPLLELREKLPEEILLEPLLLARLDAEREILLLEDKLAKEPEDAVRTQQSKKTNEGPFVVLI